MLISLLSCAFATVLGTPPQEPTTSAPLVFDEVTVIDVQAGKRIPGQRVVIVGHRIQSMGTAHGVKIPAGAQIVDARGKYLIPGLWDMHVHLDDHAPRDYPIFVGYGITGVREMAQRWDPNSAAQFSRAATDSFRSWQHEVMTGVRTGPRSVGPSADLTFMPELNPIIEGGHNSTVTVAEAVHIIDSLKAAGDAFVKFHGAPDNPVIFFALLREARRVGLPFVGHLPFTGINEVIASDSGYASVEHLSEMVGCFPHMAWIQVDSFNLQRCMPGAAALARNETYVTPTLYMFSMSGRQSMLNWNAQAPQYGQYVQLLHRVGVPMLAGTDVVYNAGSAVYAPTSEPGRSLHEELRLLVRAGLTPAAALQTATLNPARFFNAADSLGTVAVGKVADLVLLDADPLANITNTLTIRAVVANGRYFDRAALDRLLMPVYARWKANKKSPRPLPSDIDDKGAPLLGWEQRATARSQDKP